RSARAAALCHTREQLAVRAVLVEVPAPAAGHVVVPRLVLLRVRDEDVAAERLDAERPPALRDPPVTERTGPERDALEGAVEDVDAPVVEVGGVEAVVQERQALEGRAGRGKVDTRDRSGGGDRGRPAEDRAGLGREKEACGGRLARLP